MPYPGVPKSLTPKMDRCVKKVMKDGKDKGSAISICKTSIMNQEVPETKEKPEKIVADKETRHLFFSNSPFSKDGEKKINSTKEGKVLKGVEIFKAGTYKGVEFKSSALEKMVAHFHYLKAHGIFPYVPVRADHPSMFGIGNVIDKVGGYISDLRQEGKKLVADFRITNENMWSKIKEGTYVNRSAEIGTYDDNEGTIYSPVLFGVAWVDIPAVEGLSPKFSYSKDVNLINLNSINSMEKEKKTLDAKKELVEKKSDKKEELSANPKKAEKVDLKKDDEKIIEKKSEKKENHDKVEASGLSFAKQFPKEAEELAKYREEVLVNFFDKLVEGGQVLPALKEEYLEFAKGLSKDKLDAFKKLLSSTPKLVKLDNENVEVDEEEEEKKEEEAKDEETIAEEKADEFIKETN